MISSSLVIFEKSGEPSIELGIEPGGIVAEVGDPASWFLVSRVFPVFCLVDRMRKLLGAAKLRQRPRIRSAQPLLRQTFLQHRHPDRRPAC